MPTISPVSFASNQVRQQKVAFTSKQSKAEKAFTENGWSGKVIKKGIFKKVLGWVVLAALAIGAALHFVPADKLAKLGPVSGIAQQGKDLVGQLVTKVASWIPKAKEAAVAGEKVAGEVINKVA